MSESSSDNNPSGSQFQRLDELRRTHDGSEKLAGVCTGIARHFQIDPVIVRIAFVVLSFFALTGVLGYLLCWLLMPRDDQSRSPLGRFLGLTKSDATLRRWGLAIIAGLAAVTVLTSWGFRDGTEPLWFVFGLGLALLPFAFIYWLIAVLPRAEKLEIQSQETTAMPTATTEQPSTGGADYGADVHSPPTVRRRWSASLLLVTLSLVVVAFGAMWLMELLGVHVPADAYPAVALAIVTIGLFVGTRIGDGGVLVLAGIVLVPVLALTSVVSRIDIPAGRLGTVSTTPDSAAVATAPIRVRMGDVRVDLRNVSDPQNLAGKTLRITAGAADTTVIVPESVPTRIDTRIGTGTITVYGQTAATGTRQVIEGPAGPESFHIIINQRIGDIEVKH